MELSRDQLSERLADSLTQIDVGILEEWGHDEAMLALLAAEHASRCQALIRATDPAFAARLFLIIADRFVKDAQTAQDAAVRNA